MGNIFNIKPYLTFLSRNKIYTAINVFGLSVSLMFVILIGVYTAQEYSVDSQNTKLSRIYTLGFVYGDSTHVDGSHHILRKYLKQQCPEIEQTAATIRNQLMITKPDGESVNARFSVADPEIFNILDFDFVSGNARNALPDKHSVIISESFARRMFGNLDPMGKEIKVMDSISLRVTGVIKDIENSSLQPTDMIADFSYGRYFNIANMDEYFPKYVNTSGAALFVLTRQECDFDKKADALTKYLGSVTDIIGEGGGKSKIIITPLSKLYFSNMEVYNDTTKHGDRQLVNVLFAVGIVILLFAIINYVNLTVSQSGYRSREMATRRLFGAGRKTIVLQLMSESVMLCFISLAIAIVMAVIAAPYAGSLLDTRLDMTELVSPLTICLLLLMIIIVGAVAGVLPSVVISRTTPIEIVRGTFRFRTKMTLSRVFIVVQNVITIVMIGVSMTMTWQMKHLVSAPLGFNTANLINIPRYSVDSLQNASFITELKNLACVKGITACKGTPADGGNNITICDEKNNINAQLFHGDKHFMEIYGIKLIEDRHVSAPVRAFVNRRFIAECREVLMKGGMVKDPFTGELYQLGGIISDFHIRNITESLCPLVVFEHATLSNPWSYTIELQGNLTEAYNSVCEVYKQVYHETLDLDRPFIDQTVEQAFEKEIRMSKIVTLFAVIAVIISMLGLVAMSTYFIQQRNKEIAIRKVFGSTGTQIRVKLIRSFLVYVLIAFVIAVPIIWHFMDGWITRYSYRISFLPFIVIAGLLCIVISFAAVFIQSYMASNENPIKHIKDNG
ncbi:MAG: ABC transporter permease [Prevotellaceae bacterium]|nr:ABC transporter permease [Prevotellaceae bacterium]